MSSLFGADTMYDILNYIGDSTWRCASLTLIVVISYIFGEVVDAHCRRIAEEYPVVHETYGTESAFIGTVELFVWSLLSGATKFLVYFAMVIFVLMVSTGRLDVSAVIVAIIIYALLSVITLRFIVPYFRIYGPSGARIRDYEKKELDEINKDEHDV